MQRVYDYLATFTFKRKVSASAQVSLGRQMYSLGKKLVRDLNLDTVLARFDPVNKQWIFMSETETELVRRPPKGLDIQTLTGLEPQPVDLPQPIQLTLPFLVA